MLTRTVHARTMTRTRLARTKTRTSLIVTYCKLPLNLQSLSSNNNEHKVKIHMTVGDAFAPYVKKTGHLPDICENL